MTMENLNVLRNGAFVLENSIENEFETAQDILDNNNYTKNIDAECAYSDRPENNFERSYGVKIERESDYKELHRKIRIEKRHWSLEQGIRRDAVLASYRRDEISNHDARKQLDDIDNETCPCKICSFEVSYDEWKTGKTIKGKRLGKAMTSAGLSKDTIDFYSQQIKTEKDGFITITSAVQFIAGMSYYNDGSWSSCQDTNDEDSHYALRLGGSMHDDKLFVAFLHDSIDDLDDMNDKMMARVVMRYITFEGEPCLVPTCFYGNNENRDVLSNGLDQLKELGIYGRSVQYGDNSDIVNVEEKGNGVFEMVVTDDVHVCETIDEYVDVECPMCSGTGEYEVFSSRLDKDVDVECPMCNGSKVYETNVYSEIDEWVEVEDKQNVKPYNEGYSINDEGIVIRVNERVIRESRGVTA